MVSLQSTFLRECDAAQRSRTGAIESIGCLAQVLLDGYQSDSFCRGMNNRTRGSRSNGLSHVYAEIQACSGNVSRCSQRLGYCC